MATTTLTTTTTDTLPESSPDTATLRLGVPATASEGATAVEEPGVAEEPAIAVEPIASEVVGQSAILPGTVEDLNQRVADLEKKFEAQGRLLEVHKQKLKDQERINKDLRRHLLNSHTKTVTEAFLGLFNYHGTHRKQFVDSVQLPPWVKVWMDKQGLKEEVMMRLEERPDNTTHQTDGREALRAVTGAWKEDDDNMPDDSYRRLVTMILVLHMAQTDEDFSPKLGPKDKNYFAQIFNDEEELEKIFQRVLDAEEFNIIALRPKKAGVGAALRKGKDKVLEKVHDIIERRHS